MKLLLFVSGGRGAGKTTFASTYMQAGAERIAFADFVRAELLKKWPMLPWFARDRATKLAPRDELGGRSIVDALVSYSEERTKTEPLCWAQKFGAALDDAVERGVPVVVNDDVRKLVEYDYARLRAAGRGWIVVHYHLDGGDEANDWGDLAALRERAEYRMSWRR